LPSVKGWAASERGPHRRPQCRGSTGLPDPPLVPGERGRGESPPHLRGGVAQEVCARAYTGARIGRASPLPNWQAVAVSLFYWRTPQSSSVTESGRAGLRVVDDCRDVPGSVPGTW